MYNGFITLVHRDDSDEYKVWIENLIAGLVSKKMVYLNNPKFFRRFTQNKHISTWRNIGMMHCFTACNVEQRNKISNLVILNPDFKIVSINKHEVKMETR